MAHTTFGLRELRTDETFSNILASTGPLDSDSAQIILAMAFDMAFGLYNHRCSEEEYHPFAPVMMHEPERYDDRSGLRHVIERFEQHQITKHFGLSLNEFLELPHHVTEMIFQTAFDIEQRHQQERIKAEEEARQEGQAQSEELRRRISSADFQGKRR